MNYMGIDHHRQYSHITLLDEKGEVVKTGRVANFRREVERSLLGIEDVKAVIEAGRSSYTMVDVMDDLGIEIDTTLKTQRLAVRAQNAEITILGKYTGCAVNHVIFYLQKRASPLISYKFFSG